MRKFVSIVLALAAASCGSTDFLSSSVSFSQSAAAPTQCLVSCFVDANKQIDARLKCGNAAATTISIDSLDECDVVKEFTGDAQESMSDSSA